MLIDKPVGWTSHDVVAVVRRQLGLRAVGHAGTLDPFATGLLVVLVGRATRLARFAEAERKTYEAIAHLGIATETDDGTGAVTEQSEPAQWPTEAAVQGALAAFAGRQLQRPPAYSAKQVGGRRAYAMARAGELVELAPVEVVVHGITLTDWRPPRLAFAATVSKGTYLRTLCRDLGARLELPAHCAELRRTAIGPWQVADAIAPEAITPEAVLPPVEMLGSMERVTIDAGERREIGFGRAIPQRVTQQGHGALISDDGTLVAVAVGVGGMWQPEVVLEPAA